MPATELTTNTAPRPFTRLRRSTQSAGLRAYAALALGVICIGFSAIFTKWANPVGAPHISGAVTAFYRVAIATIALSLPYGFYLARLRKVRGRELGTRNKNASVTQPISNPNTTSPQSALRSPRSKLLWGTLLAGLFFALDLGFWNTSLLFTSAANSTLLGNLSTLWVSLGALLIFHESLKRRFWFGMVIALAGVAVVVGRDALEHLQPSWGDLLAILSSTFYAAYILSTNRVRRSLGTMHFMWINSAAATVLLLAYVLVMREQIWGFEARQWWALVALGLVSHALGWISINYSLGHLPAPLTSVSLLSQPVITALFAVPLLGEDLALNQIGGGLLVLTGIFIVNSRRVKD